MFQKENGYMTKILIQFCIFTTFNDFRVTGQVSLKSGQSCEWSLSKTNLLDSGRLDPDFLDVAPRMNTRKGSYFCGQTMVSHELRNTQFVVFNVFL